MVSASSFWFGERTETAKIIFCGTFELMVNTKDTVKFQMDALTCSAGDSEFSHSQFSEFVLKKYSQKTVTQQPKRFTFN